MAPDAWLGAMASIPVVLPSGLAALELEKQLLRDRWEVPIASFSGGTLVRLSAQLYNQVDEAEQLAGLLHERGVRLA
jgi:hypothetical protein